MDEVAGRRHELRRGERLGNPSPHLGFVGRFGGEEQPKTNEVAVTLGGGVVRRQRARRLVLPIAAERDRDRPSGRPEIVAASHGQHCIMSENLPHATTVHIV
jgi:hypothetical protein